VDGKAPKASSTEVLGVRQLARHVYLLDWSRTKAYVPTPSGNGIHIVRRDADHPGGVPDDEYESFRDGLIEGLLRVRDPETGQQVITRVLKREDVFSGPAMDLAPDLTLELEDGGSVSILAAEQPVSPRPEYSGTHRREGVFIARGPEIKQGASLSALSILDVAPLILYSLGLAIPEEMEGRVPEQALVDAAQARRTGRSTARASTAERAPLAGTTPMMDPEAEAEIMKRLRALGYVE
jgi:predicted AlkP superfamily phosphohydrolase/phosphomutase